MFEINPEIRCPVVSDRLIVVEISQLVLSQFKTFYDSQLRIE